MKVSDTVLQKIILGIEGGILASGENLHTLVIGKGTNTEWSTYIGGFMDYPELFGNAKVVVSHAGSGTSHVHKDHTESAVLFTFFPDQARWAESLTAEGVCVGHMPIRGSGGGYAQPSGENSH